DTLLLSLKVFSGMVSTIKVRPENMAKSIDKSYILATDLADYLVKKGETFRNAHGAVGRLVNYASKQNKTFKELTLDEYKQSSSYFDADVFNIDVRTSLSARENPGGTTPERGKEALKAARTALL